MNKWHLTECGMVDHLAFVLGEPTAGTDDYLMTELTMEELKTAFR